MAKLYKVEMYLIDPNDKYANLEDIVEDIRNYTDLGVDCFNEKVVDIEWEDNIDINFWSCSVENFRKYFE